MPELFITGATGRIGTRLVPWLSAQGYGITALTRQPNVEFFAKGARIRMVEGDLAEPEKWSGALEGCDAVVHMAAPSRGASPEENWETNYQGTLNAASAAIQAGVPKFVFLSTNLVYGDVLTWPAREEDPLAPERPYPASKAAAETAVRDLTASAGVAAVILRLAFVYGDGDPHLREALPLLRSHNPQQRLHVLHHADLAQAVKLAVSDAKAPSVYNVGDDEPVQVSEVLEALNEPIPDEAAGRAIRPAIGAMETERIRRELGFRPIYPTFIHAMRKGAV